MAKSEKRKNVQSYFTQTAIRQVTLGCLIFLISIPTSYSFRQFLAKPNVILDNTGELMGTILYIGSVIVSVVLVAHGIYRHSLARPSDAKIDSILADDLTKLDEIAIHKTNVSKQEQVEETITLTGIPTRVALFSRSGTDGVVRFSAVAVVKFIFSKRKPHVYSAVIDLISGQIVTEDTGEMEYGEIKSVTTQNTSQVFWFKKALKTRRIESPDADTFILTKNDGVAMTMPLSAPELMKITGGAEIPLDDTNAKINSMQHILLNIKYGRMIWQRDERRRAQPSGSELEWINP